jgi:hypothetical protein
MKTLLFTCGVLTLFGGGFVGAQAQTAFGQSWIVTSSAVYRDAGLLGASTVISSLPVAPVPTAGADDTGLLQAQGDGLLLERGLTERIDNAEDRNVRFRERASADCLRDNAVATDVDLTYLDRANSHGVDLFDELELVLAFAERPAGTMMPETDLGRVGNICQLDVAAPRYLVVGMAKKIRSGREGSSLADPLARPRPAAEQSAKGL